MPKDKPKKDSATTRKNGATEAKLLATDTRWLLKAKGHLAVALVITLAAAMPVVAQDRWQPPADRGTAQQTLGGGRQ
ncbi:MAG: hypothetical protein AAGJ95_13930 [Cyanobacteria bacterium J06554_11]